MKTVSAAVLVLFLASISFAGWRLFLGSDAFVIGGQVAIPANQVVHGNLQAVFAQIKLADGARVDGRITAVSSTLDLAGSVGGSVLAIGSDVTVRSTAELTGTLKRINGVPYVLLLPGMLRTGSIGALPR